MENSVEEHLCDASFTAHSETESETSEGTDSNVDIDIVRSLIPGHITSPILINEHDIIEMLKHEIEKQVDEKAEKTKLTVTNVKNIIKQVLTREHVKTLIEKSQELDEAKELVSQYQPKLTRAKTKELLSTTTIPPVPPSWIPQPPPSETRILIGEDLKEDDSGDEYVPGEENEAESAASESDTSSLPPPTPPTPISMEDIATQTTYTEDGVFKIPPPKINEEQEHLANIALRTRSKINLSSTPLEEIEKSFVPPDITRDMYDLECDDDVWKDFLKGFTQPLDEVEKPTEDEEQDPEYNILADDKINKFDHEDFREDKGVQVTKKEIKQLWDELFEYLRDISQEYDGKDKEKNQDKVEPSIFEHRGCDENNSTPTEIENNHNLNELQLENQETENSEVEQPKKIEIVMEQQQFYILKQQMRQHVQILTQNFILTFAHPEFHNMSSQFHEYLLNLKLLSGEKSDSLLKPENLMPAVKLVEDWIELFRTNTKEVADCREHVMRELVKSLHLKMVGNSMHVLTFPRLILETILKSEVFLYPSLLPKIPFKSEQFFGPYVSYTDAEDRLLVFGLEEFTKLLEKEKCPNKITLKEKVSLVREYMMPHKEPQCIMKHISKTKHPRCATNPIQQYFVYGRIRPVIHYIYPLNQILAPFQRPPEELPYQWRSFLYPDFEKNQAIQAAKFNRNTVEVPQQIILINSPILPSPSVVSSPFILTTNSNIPRRPKKQSTPNVRKPRQQKILNKSFTCIDQFVSIFQRPVCMQKLIQFIAKTVSDDNPIINVPPKSKQASSRNLNMPNLNTPVKNDPDDNEDASSVGNDNSIRDYQRCVEQKKPETVTVTTLTQDQKKEKCSKNLEFSMISNTSFQHAEVSSEVEFYRNSSDIQICQTSQCDDHCSKSKDNLEETVVGTASATKSFVKKEPSGAEKKKNKLKKEFIANLSIATPEDLEVENHKSEMFALAYYDKLRETLELGDYHKIMQILGEFESEDVIDLYKNVQSVLRPKYTELAEEFLYFLKEKEAAALNQLIPWLEVHARIKFCHKLEIYFKDQPGQLKKIYNTLLEFTQMEDISIEKIKSAFLPMLKGNAILVDLFMQNFKDERPPPSLLEGPYETLDINKELARQDDEEIYEKFVVPNTEDKYGGLNCLCHCHRIEDNGYKIRYKHCNACGVRFIQGKVFVQSGRGLHPATVSFSTSSNSAQIARLQGKQVVTSVSNNRKKRSDVSPSKQVCGKENADEDTEDEEMGKRKKSVTQKSPRKRKKTESTKGPETLKSSLSPKKSPGKSNDNFDCSKDSIKPRKRTYSGKRNRKEEAKKRDMDKENGMPDEKTGDEETEISTEIEERNEAVEEQQERFTDDCMDSSGESLEKPLTPGQQTAESENELYCEESSQDNYESDSSSSSTESAKGSQSDNTNDEPPWKREEDTVILETFQKEDDKEYALQIISDKLPHRTRNGINGRFSKLMELLLETLNKK